MNDLFQGAKQRLQQEKRLKVGVRVKFKGDDATRTFAANGDYYPPDGTLGVIAQVPGKYMGAPWAVQWDNGRASFVSDRHARTVLEDA